MPPTLQQIADAFGFRQACAALKHVRKLEEAGYLQVLPNQARGIRLAGAARAATRPPAPAGAGPRRGRCADRRRRRPRPHVWLDRACSRPRRTTCCKCRAIRWSTTASSTATWSACTARAKRATARWWWRASMARSRSSVSSAARTHIRLLPRNPDYAPIVVEPRQRLRHRRRLLRTGAAGLMGAAVVALETLLAAQTLWRAGRTAAHRRGRAKATGHARTRCAAAASAAGRSAR